MASLTNHGLFYTEELGTPIRIAQVVGLTSTTFLAGKTFAASFGATPALLKAPAPLLAAQWKELFDFDKLVNPVLSVLGVSVFGFFAYRDPNPGSRHQILYSTAAALLASSIPYSLAFLHPISEKLVRKSQDFASASLMDAAAESGVAKEETTHALVDRWATVNLGRTVLSAVAAVAATWAAVDRLEVVPAVGRIVGGADRMGH